jgi:hypothetical protein
MESVQGALELMLTILICLAVAAVWVWRMDKNKPDGTR